MADNSELAFVKSHLNVLGSLPVSYPDDFQQPVANSLRKVPVFPVDLPQPPAPKSSSGASSLETIAITIKVAKPPKTFTLSSVSPTDPISDIKAQLSSQPGAPPADAQRLLLRGKALADGKLLKEYSVKDGDVVNLMLRPGFEWNWESTPAKSPVSPTVKDNDSGAASRLDVGAKTPARKHNRIPSVVLSPSPNSSSTALPLVETPGDIQLTLDAPDVDGRVADSLDAYHQKIASPQFWERMHEFLRAEFVTPEDTRSAFEAFFVGSKGQLSPNEIAKIRDTVGIVGMSGL
ncbi:hypothetical protein SCHPADRAFT_922264 [Schizopora paradoxa]|uniref:Ubiquitin-like domain-containing protein n=1 Tax=Schizopora paradoxa TaxID=27342 RepID=A0A0H2RDF3_9AGAM|nr:hypothetical protein SCHPADRAFT_922264 [Schizopora paradoxa]